MNIETNKKKKQIAILGSTGSIGTQALQVIEEHPDLYEAYALTANNRVELLIAQARKFQPEVGAGALLLRVWAVSETVKHAKVMTSRICRSFMRGIELIVTKLTKKRELTPLESLLSLFLFVKILCC